MKISLSILFLLFSINVSWAIEFYPLMTAGTSVKVTCEPSENGCLDLCKGKQECIIETVLCRNCMGSSLFFTELYRSIGRSLLPGNEILLEKIILNLKNKKLMVMDRRFFLNIIEDYNSFDFKEYYSLLCDYQDLTPVLFAELDENLGPDLSKISVFCPSSQRARVLRFD